MMISLIVLTICVAIVVAADWYRKHDRAFNDDGSLTGNWPPRVWLGAPAGDVPAHKLRNKPDLRVVSTEPPQAA